MAAPDRDCLDRILDRWPVARLATLAPDGSPHLVPVVFARAAGCLWSPVDGKPKAGGSLARIDNVTRDDRVTLLLDEYGDDWERLWWVRLDARASPGPGAGPGAGAEQRLAVAALEAKYPQYGSTPLFAGEPTLLRIRWHRVSAWAAAGLDRLPRRFPPEPTT